MSTQIDPEPSSESDALTLIRAELQELRDKDYIRERLDLYAFLLDTARWKDIPEEIFTDDATDFHLPESTPPRVPRGRQELGAFFDEVMEDFAGTQHMMGNFSIQIQGDDATSRTYALCAHWMDADGPKPADWTVAICYDDKWRRTSIGWRIYERRLHSFGPYCIAAGSPPRNQTQVGCDLYGARDR